MSYIDATLADEAVQLTSSDRHQVYGHPADDFSRVALIWEAILNTPVTPEQVALCMVGIKLARLGHTPEHRDSVVDAIGYLLTYRACIERNNPNAHP